VTCPICSYEGTDPAGHDNAKHLAAKKQYKGRVTVDVKPERPAPEQGEPEIPAVIRRLGFEADYLAGLRGERLPSQPPPVQRSLSLVRPQPEFQRPQRTGGDEWWADR